MTFSTWNLALIAMAAAAPLLLVVPLALAHRRQRTLIRDLTTRCDEAQVLVDEARAATGASAAATGPDLGAQVALLRTSYRELTGNDALSLDRAQPPAHRLLALRHELLDAEWQLLSDRADADEATARMEAAVSALYPDTSGDLGTYWTTLREDVHAVIDELVRGLATRAARDAFTALLQRLEQVDSMLQLEPTDWSAPLTQAQHRTGDAREAMTALGALVRELPEASADAAEDTTAGFQSALAQLDQALLALEESTETSNGGNDATSGREEELKELIMQFTRDSRDMLNCIAQLEQANQELEQQLAALQGDAARTDAA